MKTFFALLFTVIFAVPAFAADLVHIHPDGAVIVKAAGKSYSATLSDFAHDYGSAAPAMPAGYDELIYIPAQKHEERNRQGDTVQKPLTWTQGDAIIAAIDTLITMRNQRTVPPDGLYRPIYDYNTKTWGEGETAQGAQKRIDAKTRKANIREKQGNVPTTLPALGDLVNMIIKDLY